MKLYYTHTSPFVREVRVVALETGLDARIEPLFLRPAPTRAAPTLGAWYETFRARPSTVATEPRDG